MKRRTVNVAATMFTLPRGLWCYVYTPGGRKRPRVYVAPACSTLGERSQREERRA